jgi:hypothetical protein
MQKVKIIVQLILDHARLLLDIIYEMLKQLNLGSFSGVRNLLHAGFEKKKILG